LHDIRFVEDDWEARRWAPGARLGVLVRRHGSFAIHLLSAGLRHRVRAGGGRTDLRPSGWLCMCRASTMFTT
jgi:hypothetical protein